MAWRWVRRALAWAGVAAISSIALGARVSGAAAEGATLRGGLELLERLGPDFIGEAQGFELNGERIWISSKLTELGVPEVLDAVERDCARGGARLSSDFARWPKALRALFPGPERLLVARSGNSAGQVACFTDGEGHDASLADRAREFARSGDLAAFGNAHYVVARRHGGAGKTHVLAIWTEGSFNIRALFPVNGDSPGSDSAVVSRPTASVRLLSARRLDAASALHLYKTSESPANVLAAVARELSQKGFSSATLPESRESAELLQSSRAFFKDGASVIVTASHGLAIGTSVSIVELESAGRAVVRDREAP